MMKKLRAIKAADDGASKLQTLIDLIEDDFDYLISGLQKLDRTDATSSNQGLMIAESLNTAIQSAIDAVADAVSE